MPKLINVVVTSDKITLQFKHGQSVDLPEDMATYLIRRNACKATDPATQKAIDQMLATEQLEAKKARTDRYTNTMAAQEKAARALAKNEKPAPEAKPPAAAAKG